ncbi:MAG: DoxX family protein [Rikenellaceae bacterium]|nr:DoxX family protein [Rikenellaceae bacterium]
MENNKFIVKTREFLFSDTGKSSALLFLRIFTGIMILTHGIPKITNFPELSRTFADPIGLGSTLSVLLMIFAEVICACLIMVGLMTRLAAIPLVIGLFVAAFLTGPEFDFTKSESAILYLGIFLSIMISGGGRYSVDHILDLYYRRKDGDI